MKTLIIDDDADLCAAYKREFERRNYTCDICTSGDEAFKMVFVNDYDNIVVDLDLGRQSSIQGGDIVSALKQSQTKALVFVFTSNPDRNVHMINRKNGAKACVSKSYQPRFERELPKTYDFDFLLPTILEAHGFGPDGCFERYGVVYDPKSRRIRTALGQIPLGSAQDAFIRELVSDPRHGHTYARIFEAIRERSDAVRTLPERDNEHIATYVRNLSCEIKRRLKDIGAEHFYQPTGKGGYEIV